MSASERFGVHQRAVQDVLRLVLGPQCQMEGACVLKVDGGYCVLRAEVRTPARAIVVKLCDPGDPRAGGFARAAAFARLVRERSDVPTFDVLAVDASGERWPWGATAYGSPCGVRHGHLHTTQRSCRPACGTPVRSALLCCLTW